MITRDWGGDGHDQQRGGVIGMITRDWGGGWA